MNTKPAFPDSLRDVSFNGMNITELWILKELLEADRCEITHLPDKFGYQEAYLDVEDQRHKIKYKYSYQSGKVNTYKIFYVRKH